jgi:hypothetical protein
VTIRIDPGDRFTRWTVLSEAEKVGKERAFLCRCDCGTERVVLLGSLRTGKTQSCSCLNKEILSERDCTYSTHGHTTGDTQTRTYTSWSKMLYRCRTSTCHAYADYGGRGISVCERWLSFENFLADMGERPEGKTLDRWPDNDGNYEPGNARWATPKEQQANRRNTPK